jgi:RNase P subunit RPR2
VNAQELSDIFNKFDHSQFCSKCKKVTKHNHSPYIYDPDNRVMRTCKSCGIIKMVIFLGKTYCKDVK